MQQMWLENYRCFREKQTARLAPLTLLVGDNSTGKTSFLAMARCLSDVFHGKNPDFKDEPYDLGSFDELACRRGGRAERTDRFRAGFSGSGSVRRRRATRSGLHYQFDVVFGRKGAAPVVQRAGLKWNDAWLRLDNNAQELTFGEKGNEWQWPFKRSVGWLSSSPDEVIELPWYAPIRFYALRKDDARPTGAGSAPPSDLIREMLGLSQLTGGQNWRPFATAPVRSRPRRTYEPGRHDPDPEGSHIPMLLADLYLRRPKRWESLRQALEDFGRRSGLFDELAVRPLGKGGAVTFQLQVRKRSKTAKGPFRNMIDVGYGVNQALPILVELLQHDSPRTFLLQQPEVHLHPSAQASLGTLFCELAAGGKQLLVETHSDHLIDRIRMDVRDRRTELKPEDVSILYFERGNLDVHIHSIRLDGEGNVLGAPPGYRQFFMDETNRYLKL